MADRKITELSAMSAGGQATGDLLTIVDVSEAAAADKNKKITVENLFKGIPSNVGIGTASPAAFGAKNLEVNGGTGGAYLVVKGSNNAHIGELASDGAIFLSSKTSSNLIFRTNDLERARIDSSGRVGIGTSSPSQKLHVSASSGDVAALIECPGHPILRLKTTGTSDNTSVDFADSGSDTKARLIYTHGIDTFQIVSNGSERMRIESGGASIFSGTVAPKTDNTHNVGGASLRWSAIYAVNGTIQTSDQREKTNILDSSLGVNFIKSLRPVSYKWINGGQVESSVNEEGKLEYTSHAGQRTHWGFIAQEVKQSVDDAGVDFGGWVLTDKDDSDSQQALRYDQFIAPLTKALQEAITKIETLEAKVAALEAE